METKTVVRVTAGVVVTLTAYAFLGAAGLWGVALAAPVLVFAPSMLRDAVVERRHKRALDVELAMILGGDRGEA